MTFAELFMLAKAVDPQFTIKVEVSAWNYIEEDPARPVELTFSIWSTRLQGHFEARTAEGALQQYRDAVKQTGGIHAVGNPTEILASEPGAADGTKISA